MTDADLNALERCLETVVERLGRIDARSCGHRKGRRPADPSESGLGCLRPQGGKVKNSGRRGDLPTLRSAARRSDPTCSWRYTVRGSIPVSSPASCPMRDAPA